MRGAWLLLIPGLACAQFSDLATVQDGSRLYFVSSYRQHGAAQHLYPKVFALDAAGVSLAVQPAEPGPNAWERYTLGPLQPAPDGSWLVYGRQNLCQGGSSCFLNEQRSATLAALGRVEGLAANARLSRDGRWLLGYSSPGVMISYFYRTDRRTGTKVDLSKGPRPASAPSVAANGAVLIPAFDRLVLWTEAGARQIGPGSAAAAMDDGGTVVVYQQRDARRLRVVDVATGREWPLGPDDRDNWAPVLSADGRSVLYLSSIGGVPQAFFSAPDGSGWRQLTDLRAGVREATLSGDGRVAWVAANDGAILRISTATAEVEQRIAPTPGLTGPAEGAIGSAALLTGSGLDVVKAVWVAGRPAPLTGAFFQIPGDMSEVDAELLVEGGDPAFDDAIPFHVRTWSPVALGQAIHADFSALVTPENPAAPGEIVHLYATGLGPVADSRVTLPYEWLWSMVPETPAEVLYAGLAPGFPGFYQVDVRVPADPQLAALPLDLQLKTPDGGWFRWNMANIPVRP